MAGDHCTCTFPECTNQVHIKKHQLCRPHYFKAYRSGGIQEKKGVRVTKECAYCGSEMNLLPAKAQKQECCSISCGQKLRSAAEGRNIRDRVCVCPVCSAEFHKTRNNFKKIYCSHDCRRTADIEQASLRKDRRDKIHGECLALRAIRRNIRRWIKTIPDDRRCSDCGSAVGARVSYCDPCRDARQKISRKRSKRTYKAWRRAVERGVEADKIDPISVFKRDKWKCQMCGRSTPESLRGSYNDRAPELDHIVPLAAGGKHQWGNVQCSCRDCNLSKSDKPMGQVGFNFPVSQSVINQ